MTTLPKLYEDIYLKIDGWYEMPSSLNSGLLDLAIHAINHMSVQDLTKISQADDVEIEILDRIMAAVDRTIEKGGAGGDKELDQIKSNYLSVFLSSYQNERMLSGKSSRLAFWASFFFDSIKGASVFAFAFSSTIVSTYFSEESGKKNKGAAGVLLTMSSGFALLYFLLSLLREGLAKYYSRRWAGEYISVIKKIKNLATLRLRGIEYVREVQVIATRHRAEDVEKILERYALKIGEQESIAKAKKIIQKIAGSPSVPVFGEAQFFLPGKQGELRDATTWRYDDISLGEQDVVRFDQAVATLAQHKVVPPDRRSTLPTRSELGPQHVQISMGQ